MYLGEKILAIIPARKNSKGLPGKNTKNFLGKPLFVHSIDHAMGSKLIDDIVVTSDSSDINLISSKIGVQCIPRPENLATDTAHTPDAITHAVEWIKQRTGMEYNLIVMLQPTSPLRNSKDIDTAIKMLQDSSRRSIVSVCESSCNLKYINTLPKNLCMSNFLDIDGNASNRQYYDKSYQLNGAIYVSWYDYFLENKGFYGPETYAYTMPKERSVDIDTNFDFKLAEFFGRELKK